MHHLDKLRPLTLLLFRVALGMFFISHGWPRLVGHTADVPQFFADHVVAGSLSYLFGVLEVFGGALLIAGLFTRAVALLLAIRMGYVVWKIVSLQGYLAVREYESTLILCTACLLLASIGAGILSVDRPLFGDKSRVPRSPRK